MNWDDLKYFLAVCRNGSIRAAATELQVNHATVSRRINSFEASLGRRLFERSPQGYQCTAMGDEIFAEAEKLEQSLKAVERRVAGNDASMVGEIRVTSHQIIAEHLLMPAIAEFCQLYPDIHIEIIDSFKLLSISNREADVAFRLCDSPPEHLIGRKLATIHRACYIAANKQAKLADPTWLAQQNWLGWSDKQQRPIGKIAKSYPKLASRHKLLSPSLQVAACKQGMGVAILGCFIGDTSKDLVRIPPYLSVPKYDLWILSHPDLQQNKKVLTFVRFMTKKFLAQRELIEGKQFTTPSSD
ncbi:LysR family transcriptional regulator [Agarivorans aestuarii]|uniref:LysR family transcriptional regulator n=1 Tax=Agarivorans aestuarii TaxID=1563703 RepID=A0ABU7G254_9ALTE|nr:LysR family transcriptional regulator [Agarivorans aestuarii]MEE1673395.1 LysR family transcriptional regulator [Agarivorans aestuarii]